MNAGEWLLRGSAWLAFAGYAFGEMQRILHPHTPARLHIARLAWTAGCLSFLVHVAAAFQVRHHWSHAAALVDTARQTREFTGVDWGGGLWFNYLFAVIWLGCVAMWWLRPELFVKGNRWLLLARCFFYFMWFNATVIFIHGPQRWVGLAVCVALGAVAWRGYRRNTIA